MKLSIDKVLAGILLAALAVNTFLATTTPYYYDELLQEIPAAKSISFSITDPHLPIRALNHPALPSYWIKLSSVMFGETKLGFRALNVLAGVTTIWLVFALARSLCGLTAARWAALLIAFNDYFMRGASLATSTAPFYVLLVAALIAFSRFARSGQPVWLFATATVIALAYYCKETTVLLFPALFLTLWFSERRHWLRRWEPYAAVALFVVAVSPDLIWNFTGRASTEQATYHDQFARIGGLGLSIYPLAFYGRSAITFVTGEDLDHSPEYETTNPLAGAVLILGVLAATGRLRRLGSSEFMLVLLFWSIFLFFTLIRPGDQTKLDRVSWAWVLATLPAAAILAGDWLARVPRLGRPLAWTAAGGGLLYAVISICLRTPTQIPPQPPF